MPARRSAARRRLFAAAMALVAAPAGAQLLDDPRTVVVPPPPPVTTARSIFVHDDEVPVADRVLPALTATGIPVGDVDLYPGLAVGGFYDSNVYADNARRHDDAAVVIRPELTGLITGGPYTLTSYVRGDIRRYATFTSEDTQEVLGGASGSVAVGALSTISAGINGGALIEPRFAADSPTNAARPLHYGDLDGFVATTLEGASTRVVLRGDVERLRFGATPAFGGGYILTKDRDRTRYSGLVRVERALSPRLSFYGAVTGNIIDYTLPIAGGGTRDSKGYGLYLGSSFEVTRLARGDIRVGYIRQDFDLGNVRPIQGIGALGSLQVFPTRLWTFTLAGESTIEDSGVPGTLGILHRGASLRADNELRRYLLLTLEGEFYRDTYRGLTRRDSLPGAEAALTYLSRHHWNARLGYRYRARSCTCTTDTTSFSDHRVSATLTFQY